jgi:hypothetical protein
MPSVIVLRIGEAIHELQNDTFGIMTSGKRPQPAFLLLLLILWIKFESPVHNYYYLEYNATIARQSVPYRDPVSTLKDPTAHEEGLRSSQRKDGIIVSTLPTTGRRKQCQQQQQPRQHHQPPVIDFWIYRSFHPSRMGA